MESKLKIGWIGLGHMGMILAKNLHEAGYDIKVWNRTVSKARESGLPYEENLVKLIKESDIIITMLFGSQSSEEVYQEIVNSGANLKGKIFIDLTTIHPETARKIAELLISNGAEFIEAPVIGSVIPAQNKELIVLISGDREIFEKTEEIFKNFGKDIFYMGDYGKASTMKLINNAVLGSMMVVLSEGVLFGKKAGIPLDTVVQILGKGAGNSELLKTKKEKILKNDYSTQFSLALLHKDICYAQDIAKNLNFPAIFTGQALNFYSSARANNLEEKDFSAIIEIYKKLANIEEAS
ncbi:NAD(P)-dependent oxidoreductase [Persephonella sp. KM09-Lau-8]|uniref:NAD(P)-dependent oxidoreductase n=1 Tax=Persephonella sp. KM09-Lau-8 TaxID=1158345 RepID=UPI000496032D|nr:NAD(P)-dependent oxidoreductase [Persephonella sp. KM09-Lau-8]